MNGSSHLALTVAVYVCVAVVTWGILWKYFLDGVLKVTKHASLSEGMPFRRRFKQLHDSQAMRIKVWRLVGIVSFIVALGWPSVLLIFVLFKWVVAPIAEQMSEDD